MADVLTRAIGLFLIIFLGYFFKVKKIAKREDGLLLSKIIMNVTLPCSILASTSKMDFSLILIIPFLLGIACNMATDLFALWRTRSEDGLSRAVAVVQNSGYNIGTFTLPFVQSFFPASYIMTVLLFDSGNSIMVLRGNYLIAQRAKGEEAKFSLKEFILSMFSSVPLCVYILTLALSLLKITLPSPVLSIVSIAGNANPFLAMFMIGIMVDFNIDLSRLKRLFQLLLQRLAINLGLAGLIYFLLPLDLIAKQMLVIALMSPISSLSAVYALLLGSKEPETANLNSLSILISLLVMTILLLLFA